MDTHEQLRSFAKLSVNLRSLGNELNHSPPENEQIPEITGRTARTTCSSRSVSHAVPVSIPPKSRILYICLVFRMFNKCRRKSIPGKGWILCHAGKLFASRLNLDFDVDFIHLVADVPNDDTSAESILFLRLE